MFSKLALRNFNRSIFRSFATIKPKPLTFSQAFSRRSLIPFLNQCSRTFSSSAKQPDMFCYQCEQTRDQKGCTTVGVCGKTPEVASLQDLLMYCCKGISMYAKRARDLGPKYADIDIDRFVGESLFATMTNVNFDSSRFLTYLEHAATMRDKAKALYETACREKKVKPEALSGPANFKLASGGEAALIEQGKSVGVFVAKQKQGEDITGLQEMVMYGLKGCCAYADHAMTLGKEDSKCYELFHTVLNELTNPNPTVPSLLKLALLVGELNLNVMGLLDAGHTSTYGHPEPTKANTNPLVGKCILVSGHDLTDLEKILKQTEGKGINVYTHGEMLPGHAYPGLKKFRHLAGHYGGPWQLQKMEFGAFPGPIVMTSNCLIEPKKSYSNRIFTRRVVGWPGIDHIVDDDFSRVIEAAKECDGFTEDDVADVIKKQPLTIGFARNAVLGVADKVIGAIKSGAIKHFFVIGGCDGSEGERSYFRDLANSTPKDSIILTMGCGKFRINNLNLGDIGGIPRVLDMGQCNDAYSAIQVAIALASALKTDVNSLPLSFAVSWFEQKAVAVLLTLLHLNIQNIRLGPHLPGFATPAMLQALDTHFKLKQTGRNAAPDLKLMLANA